MANAYRARFIAFAAAIAAATPVPSTAAEPQGAALDPAENFAIEHDVGRRFRIDAAELPKPKSGPIVNNGVLTVPFNGQTLAVPKGFTATPFVVGLVNRAASSCCRTATCSSRSRTPGA
jgi:hypothetical protein